MYIYIYTYSSILYIIISNNILHLKQFLTPFGATKNARKQALRLLWHCGNSAQGRVETLQADGLKLPKQFTSDLLPHVKRKHGRLMELTVFLGSKFMETCTRKKGPQKRNGKCKCRPFVLLRNETRNGRCSLASIVL